MTYSNIPTEDQKSVWFPRALIAVGLGAMAFVSGTIYSSNTTVPVATNLIRGGLGRGGLLHALGVRYGLEAPTGELAFLYLQTACPLVGVEPDPTGDLAELCDCARKCDDEGVACGTDDTCEHNALVVIPDCLEDNALFETPDCLMDADKECLLALVTPPGEKFIKCLLKKKCA